jgi:PAS domain S-box-containing protein
VKFDTAQAFFAGDTDLARLFRQQDWSESPLGSPARWPQSLRSVVQVMLGSAFPMFIAWGPKLAMVYNAGYADFLGTKHPTALGQPLYEVWSEIEGDLIPLVTRALSGEPFFMENLPLRMRRRGFDEDCWFTFSYSPVLDDSGSIAGIYCACTETTNMVLAEREQRAERERLQNLFSQAPGFLAVMRGPQHVFESANHAFMQTIGFRDIIGKSVAEALPEVVEQGFTQLLDRVYTSGEPFVGRSLRLMIKRQQGAPLTEAYIDFVYQPLTDAAGVVEGILVQGHEVTEQHRAQEALLVFSNSIPAIAWVARPDGSVERFNSQWEVYTGQDTDSAIDHGWLQALHPDDRAAARQAWEDARTGHEPWKAEYRLRQHDGTFRWFYVRCVPQFDASGQVVRWFGTTTDIEDARQTAQALREADRQKDEFLATLAHELRNPLAPIRTAVQLLNSPATADPVRARAAEVIGRQTGHMARLLDDLIDIARITQQRMALKREAVSIDYVVQCALEAARPAADAKGHTLTVALDSPQAMLWVDPLRITQVLSNLLNNAVKYSDPGGQILLGTKVVDSTLELSVTDTGIGLSADAITHIFAMFAQEKSALDRSDGGLGIGLALAKGLVELHGGTLAAFSDGLGKGSRFVVYLPLASQAVQPAAPVEAEALPAACSQARSILLADDNLDSAETLAELLRMEGHTVHTANDGMRAAAMALQLRPDVIVLDIGMPGLNGYEVARQVRAQPWGGEPFLIAATGWGREGDREKARAAGFDKHLTKPFDPQQLTALVANCANF